MKEIYFFSFEYSDGFDTKRASGLEALEIGEGFSLKDFAHETLRREGVWESSKISFTAFNKI